MRTRQAHRGVEIVGTGGECSVEDGHVETRVDDIEHMRDAVGAARLGNRGLVRGIEGDAGESRIGDAIGETTSASLVVVRTDPGLEEVPTGGDERSRGAHST